MDGRRMGCRPPMTSLLRLGHDSTGVKSLTMVFERSSSVRCVRCLTKPRADMRGSLQAAIRWVMRLNDQQDRNADITG